MSKATGDDDDVVVAMDEEEEQSELPSAIECDRRTKQFAQVTGTDEACAHMYLQDCNWDVEIGINRYFSDNHQQEQGASGGCTAINLLTWNIDGLDTANLSSRTTAVCNTIDRIRPDIVFLQEVVPVTHATIESKLSTNYDLISGAFYVDQPYYSMIMTHRARVRLQSQLVRPFATSQMGRCLIEAEASIDDVQLRLMTAHLESCADSAAERVKQLKECIELLEKKAIAMPQCLAIFGGDLNVRDKEVPKLPTGICDVWEACGSPKDHRYTWDCIKNDNKHDGRRLTARCRFDRVYWNANGPFGCNEMQLIGKERIRAGLCFASDHWAIHAIFRKR